MRYWLFKSEPTAFSIDDLNKRPKQTEHWDGVRNYQVRNLLRDEIKRGDQAFFYHSSCTPPGIAGIIEVSKPAILILLPGTHNQNITTLKARAIIRAGLWSMYASSKSSHRSLPLIG